MDDPIELIRTEIKRYEKETLELENIFRTAIVNILFRLHVYLNKRHTGTLDEIEEMLNVLAFFDETEKETRWT